MSSVAKSKAKAAPVKGTRKGAASSEPPAGVEQLLENFKDPDLCRSLLAAIHDEGVSLRFMEVCGTHTVSIFQSGIHSLLKDQIVHLTGPGCPVCVTHDREVAAYLEMASRPDVIIATFGDLMKVPGPKGRNLKAAMADGARVKVVYSPFDSLAIAEEHKDATVVFLGIGFETTAPTVAATVLAAKARGLKNFKVISFHKLVPPALHALLTDPAMRIEGFILPGHVSAVIGLDPYLFLGTQYGLPAAVAGFEPVDILQALHFLVRQKKTGGHEVANLYTRVVPNAGNPKAMAIMNQVFEPSDALWRGIGVIPGSGLAFRKEFREFDAMDHFRMELPDVPPIKGCKCGEVLKGIMPPNKCPLFKKACTPATPVGPCMVSTEGSCAAYFKYQLDV